MNPAPYFEAGEFAQRNGMPASPNPFEKHAKWKAAAWLQGWHAAAAEEVAP